VIVFARGYTHTTTLIYLLVKALPRHSITAREVKFWRRKGERWGTGEDKLRAKKTQKIERTSIECKRGSD
jgi:hypothetical protein